MTSKNSFFKLLLQNSRRRIWCFALSILAFFFALPIYGALEITRWIDNLHDNETVFSDVIYAFQSRIIGGGNGFLTFVIIVFAVVSALNGFSYLFSKQKTDLFHSMPLKRETLFFVRYINGLLYFLIPYAVALIITIFIGQAYGAMTHYVLQIALSTFFIHIAGFLLIYTLTILAIMLTGNLIVALLGTGVFLAYGPATVSVITMYFSTFFKTYYSFGEESAIPTSALTLYVEALFQTMSSTGTIHFPVIRTLCMIVATALLLILCIVLYKKRPSEVAGKAMAFHKTQSIIEILLIIPIALFSGVFFCEISTNSSDGWFLFGLIISLLLFHVIIQTIYYFDFKASLKNKHCVLISAVFIAVIACLFRFDLTGYDRYIPDAAQIDSAAIGSYDLQGNINYYDFNQTNTDPDYSASNYADVMNQSYYYDGPYYYTDSNTYRFKNMKLTDTDAILALARVCMEYTNGATAPNGNIEPRNYDVEEASDTTEMETGICNIIMKYNLKNGKSVYRTYQVKLLDNMDYYDLIYRSKEYKEGVFPILTMRDEDIKNFYYSSPIGSMALSDLSQEELTNLVHTYQDELLAQDAYDTRDSSPIGYLFSRKTITSDSQYSDYYDENQGYIYPSFTKTIALLNQYGINTNQATDLSNILSISVSNYNSVNDSVGYNETASADYTSASDIKEILSLAVPSEYYTIDSFLHPTDELDIQVTYKEVPKDYSNICSFSFPKGTTPDRIAKAVDFNK